MDFEYFDPNCQTHMDMVAMMMTQMEKLPAEFSSAMPPPSSVLDFSNPSSPLFHPAALPPPPTTTISFAAPPHLPAHHSRQTSLEPSSFPEGGDGEGAVPMAAMREMIFRIAAMQPVHIDPESVRPPKRRNVRISKDPQSVAARHRRERISERIRILQRLVPGGTKMDTASMLDEAIHYVKFLKNQVQSLEKASADSSPPPALLAAAFSAANSNSNSNSGGYYYSGVSGTDMYHEYSRC